MDSLKKVLLCEVKIANHSTMPMHYVSYWYEHGGQVGDWPMLIGSGDEVIVVNSAEADEKSPGVSGYVVYKLNGQDVAIAFSNPVLGSNKFNVALASSDTNGKNAWDEMVSHDEPWAMTLIVGGKAFNVACEMTHGPTNKASATFYLASQ